MKEVDVIARAEKYYQLVAEKNIQDISDYLDPNVEFSGPLAALKGKQSVIQAVENFTKAFRSLKIRVVFGGREQAMVVYDVDIPGVAEKFPGASLLKFREGQIVRMELFYDGSKFLEMREQIFS